MADITVSVSNFAELKTELEGNFPNSGETKTINIENDINAADYLGVQITIPQNNIYNIIINGNDHQILNWSSYGNTYLLKFYNWGGGYGNITFNNLRFANYQIANGCVFDITSTEGDNEFNNCKFNGISKYFQNSTGGRTTGCFYNCSFNIKCRNMCYSGTSYLYYTWIHIEWFSPDVETTHGNTLANCAFNNSYIEGKIAGTHSTYLFGSYSDSEYLKNCFNTEVEIYATSATAYTFNINSNKSQYTLYNTDKLPSENSAGGALTWNFTNTNAGLTDAQMKSSTAIQTATNNTFLYQV